MLFKMNAKWEVKGPILVEAPDFRKALSLLEETPESVIKVAMESGSAKFVDGSIRACRTLMAEDIRANIASGFANTLDMVETESYALLKGLTRKAAAQEIFKSMLDSINWDLTPPPK